jgi:hypothetical protein
LASHEANKLTQGSAPAGATGDELELLSMLIKGDNKGGDGFELSLFEEEEEMMIGKKKKDGGENVEKGTKAAPVAKRSSLSKAMKEVKEREM